MRLALGTMHFGTRTDDADSFALLDRFVEAGGRIVDTANCYAFWQSETGHGGQSERTVGAWLAANPGVRDTLTIATKVGVEPLTPFDPDGDPPRLEGLGGDVVRAGAEASRERLGIERIDLFWAHGEDRSVDLAETVEAFGALAAEGAIGRVGFSNHPVWRVERARALAAERRLEPCSALQLTTSYVHPRPGTSVPGKDHRFGFVSDETRDYLDEHPEMELWVYSPLIQGSLDRPDRPLPEVYDHPGTSARLAALAEVARRHDAAPSQVVLAWLGRFSVPIVGVSSLAQLDSALAAQRLRLDADDLAALDAPA